MNYPSGVLKHSLKMFNQINNMLNQINDVFQKQFIITRLS